MMNDRARPQGNRTLLGILVALLGVAILLALYFLIFDDDGTSAASGDSRAMPTPLTIATSTPAPSTGLSATAPTAVATSPTSAPVVAATPVPDGFTACTGANAPLTTGTYIVDTNTTPLNQRVSPDVSSELAGTFAPGQDDLVFTGDCVVNNTDGFTWWQIFNGTDDVWIASEFVTPN